jgi:deoxyribodipyrimidine photo-lyase
LQKTLPPHLDDAARPLADALATIRLPQAIELPASLTKRWPMATAALLARDPAALAALPIDHEVGATEIRGGADAAARTLDAFFDDALERYGADRNHPDDGAASGLSPHLHFGHLSVHEVFARIVEREGWSAARLAQRTLGKREGWWGMSPAAESFLDELITWRELGYNHCARNPDDYDRYESLPGWARTTLEAHARDPRKPRYPLAALRDARTDDEVWNAAQRELIREGRMHNYLRMLWGKKILEWTKDPREALAVMIELNNRYALDGRDPNSYSGIFWCLGRYDRPWFPERPIFGNIRYMSSKSALKKLRMKNYLACFASA